MPVRVRGQFHINCGAFEGRGEDVDAAGITPGGTILLSTMGSFGVPGVSGADEDVLQFAPLTTGSNTSGAYSMFLDLTSVGISSGANVWALDLVE